MTRPSRAHPKKRAGSKRKTPVVFVVSDGRGETATMLLKAASVQFAHQRYRIERRAELRTPEEVRSAVESAAEAHAVIFYTLVSEDTRRTMRRTAGELHVPVVDLLGPAFTALHDLFQSERGAQPGLLYATERERIDRLDAVDYTLKHDDGQRPHELSAADVVLVGVSRASKSSTCFVLAYQGVRAANVPLLPDVPPPPQLLRLPPEKVIGLRVNVMRLISVREARAQALGFRPNHPYVDKRSIAREVLEANRIMEEHHWRSFDASYMAVEEVAKEVMRLRGRKGRTPW